MHTPPKIDACGTVNTNRNALYKAMHDARLKLKRQLEKQGHSPEKLLKVFSD